MEVQHFHLEVLELQVKEMMEEEHYQEMDQHLEVVEQELLEQLDLDLLEEDPVE